ncbi:unnamed protein product [Caenorhabditis nigoni]
MEIYWSERVLEKRRVKNQQKSETFWMDTRIDGQLLHGDPLELILVEKTLRGEDEMPLASVDGTSPTTERTPRAHEKMLRFLELSSLKMN